MRSRYTRVRSVLGVTAILSLCLQFMAPGIARPQAAQVLTVVSKLELGLGNFMGVADGLAYVTTLRGLDIIDIRNPHQVARIGSVPLGSAFEVAIAGDYAYVQAGPIRIVNVGEGDNCSVQGTFGSGGYSALAVRDGLLFAARTRDGLEILDLSDPTAPVEVGRYEAGGYNALLGLNGRIAYLGDLRYGVQLLDISDPTSPIPLTTLPGTGSPDPQNPEHALHGILSGLLVHEDLLIVGLRGEHGCLLLAVEQKRASLVATRASWGYCLIL